MIITFYQPFKVAGIFLYFLRLVFRVFIFYLNYLQRARLEILSKLVIVIILFLKLIDKFRICMGRQFTIRSKGNGG